MNARLLLWGCMAGLLIGCPNNGAPNVQPSHHYFPPRSIAPIVPQSSTKPPRTSSDPNATGSVSSSTLPTIKPPLASPDPSASPLPPGQVEFTIGAEKQGVWGMGPYLVRPRAAFVAGNVGNAIIVAEGDHRPSLEVLDPAKDGNWRLDTRHDPDAGMGYPNLAHTAGLMWAAGGVYQGELWTAGGFDGQLSSVATSGTVDMYLYRVKEGFSKARRSDEGVRTLATGKPTRAAVGGVIGDFLYVCGGTFGDIQAGGLYDGTGVLNVTDVTDFKPVNLKATVRKETQKVSLTTFDDATVTSDMPTGVASAASVVYQGHLYVLGGYTFDEKGVMSLTDKVQEYDPEKGTWLQSGDANATVPALPVPMHSAAAAATAHKLFVAGGMGIDGKPRNTFYYFDFNAPPTMRAWKEAPSMPTARAMLALVPFQDALWAIGGVGEEGSALRTVEKFYTEIPSL